MYDVVIIGGGAAGLTAAIYTGRSGLKTVLINKGVIGGIASVIDMIENYPGFPDGISGMKLMQTFEKQARKWGVEIIADEAVGIEYDDYKKIVKTKKAVLETWTVIIATGSEPKRLGVPGEEKFIGRGISFCATCDGPLFKDKDLMVVGAGNSGLQEGLFLLRFARSLTFVEVLPKIQAEKVLIDRVTADPRVRFLLNHVVVAIEGKESVEGVRIMDRETKKTKVVPVSGLFIYVGFHPETEFLKGKIRMDGSGYIITDENMETTVKGIMAAGDVRRKFARQVSTAIGDGAAAAIAAHRYVERLKELG